MPDDYYKNLFEAAVLSIAEISMALGIPDEEAASANGNDLILDAIESLKEQGAGNEPLPRS